MGSTFLTTYFDGKKSEAAIRKQFEKMQERADWSSGHEYSGDWNMCRGLAFSDKKFASVKEAYDWVSENTDKWGNALCVKAVKTEKYWATRPTFGGFQKYEERGYRVNEGWAVQVYNTGTGRTLQESKKEIYPADQLTEAEKVEVVKLMQRVLDAEQGLAQAYYRRYSQAALEHAEWQLLTTEKEKANEALQAFNKATFSRLWVEKTKKVTIWFMGGWAAE